MAICGSFCAIAIWTRTPISTIKAVFHAATFAESVWSDGLWTDCQKSHVLLRRFSVLYERRKATTQFSSVPTRLMKQGNFIELGSNALKPSLVAGQGACV